VISDRVSESTERVEELIDLKCSGAMGALGMLVVVFESFDYIH